MPRSRLPYYTPPRPQTRHRHGYARDWGPGPTHFDVLLPQAEDWATLDPVWWGAPLTLAAVPWTLPWEGPAGVRLLRRLEVPDLAQHLGEDLRSFRGPSRPGASFQALVDTLPAGAQGIYWEPTVPVAAYPLTEADQYWAQQWGWHPMTLEHPRYLPFRCRQVALWFQALKVTVEARFPSCTWGLVAGPYPSLWEEGASPQDRTGLHWSLLEAPQLLQGGSLRPLTHALLICALPGLPPIARLWDSPTPRFHSLTPQPHWGLQTAQLHDRLEGFRQGDGLALCGQREAYGDVERFLTLLRDRITVLQRQWRQRPYKLRRVRPEEQSLSVETG